ncbi:MAG: hypothetical protein HYY02_00835 [Chloroflexi bacterium]|nr:hypothetical protein [Chloroflexota bacterium]
MESVFRRRGLTFTVEIARQGGKNELSAQLEVLLLAMHAARGGTGIKCAPTFLPQTTLSMERLKARLNDAGFGRRWRSQQGHIIRLGRARMAFYSADRSANVVGATADLLLEVDEAQDVDQDKYQKEFRPMGASSNVTTVLYGTPWDGGTLLEEQKQVNQELERLDGLRRHFRYDWRAVARHNPLYQQYVEAEAARLGEGHPLFRTQYCLELLQGGRGLFSAQQRAWLQGDHPRRHRPEQRGVYVAGIDLAGEAEGDDAPGMDAAVRVREPRRDSTVVTIAQVDYRRASDLLPEPEVRVMEHLWWTGRRHATLVGELAGLLRDTWRCRRVVVDATGVGAGVASMLGKLLGGGVLHPYLFTAESKSRLGFTLLGAVNAHRLKVYAADGSPECRELWRELELGQVAYRPNQRMNFFVDQREGHDDFLMSLALAVEAANRYAPRTAKGRAGTRDDVG